MDNVCGYKIKVVSSNYHDFLHELSKSDLVLTPTRRLATRLNQDYAQLQINQKNSVWQIDIISLNGWIERLWQMQQEDVHAESPLRLNTWQTLIVWQSITDNNEQLARLAMEAWTILKEWNVDYKTIDPQFVSADVQVFLQWCEKFETFCKQQHFCDSANMLHLLKPTIKNLQKIVLIGFTDIKPIILKLFQQLINVEIEVLEFRTQNANVFCSEQQDSKSELQQAALWAKEQLSENPLGQIGVIIPDLSQRFNEVDDIFSRILAPETLLANHYHDEKSYNISSGNKLADYPIIAVVFEFLQGRNIVGSPFINNDAALSLNKKQNLTAEDWSEFIKQQLKLNGYPGHRVLNSLEYQVVKRFFALLAEYVKSDIVQKPISFATAVYQLHQQASNVVFQGESENARLQILGALEGEGLYFQSLWVLGLDQENWPPASNPHPFIPIELQREYLMPHASNEREYLFTSHLTKRFTEQAHLVILSYPQMTEDKQLMPSHLIRDYPSYKNHHSNDLLKMFDPNLTLEIWQEAHVPFKNSEFVSGGVGLLQSQSACPFQAFARYRLKIKVLEQEEVGLTFAERGELTHAALDYFWAEVKHSSVLDQFNINELDALIATAVQHAMKQLVRKKLSQQHLLIEKSRLTKLIKDWILFEKSRPEFTVVETEKNIEIKIANIKLRARIDRIDQLATGEIILIDYKTGNLPATDWLEERPQQVQLPVYALSYPSATQVAIAKVKANEHQFKYIEVNELSWDDLLNHWHKTLTQLADEFYRGVNDVSPLHGDETCQYCGMNLLCRIRSV